MTVETFEIRQRVCAVQRCWLETVYTIVSERAAWQTYESLVKEHQAEYFELVRVTHDELCLSYTPKMGDEGRKTA